MAVALYMDAHIPRAITLGLRMRTVDVLLFLVRDNPPVDAVEEPGGVIVSYGEDREPVSIEFLNASARGLVRAGEVTVTLQNPSRG